MYVPARLVLLLLVDGLILPLLMLARFIFLKGVRQLIPQPKATLIKLSHLFVRRKCTAAMARCFVRHRPALPPWSTMLLSLSLELLLLCDTRPAHESTHPNPHVVARDFRQICHCIHFNPLKGCTPVVGANRLELDSRFRFLYTAVRKEFICFFSNAVSDVTYGVHVKRYAFRRFLSYGTLPGCWETRGMTPFD